MMGIFLPIPRLIFLQTCKIDGIIFGEQIAKGRYIPRFFFFNKCRQYTVDGGSFATMSVLYLDYFSILLD